MGERLQTATMVTLSLFVVLALAMQVSSKEQDRFISIPALGRTFVLGLRVMYGWPLRLVNGGAANYGRVEVIHDGRWGTICDDDFDNNDATVICRMLGYRTGVVYMTANFGQGSGPIWLDDLNCSGSETTIF